MPRSKKFKRGGSSYRRRSYGRRKARGKASKYKLGRNFSSKILTKGTLPDSLYTKFYYYSSATITTAGGTDTEIYNANGPYDPTSTSDLPDDQPYYWDQLMNSNLYDRCIAYASKIEVIIINEADDQMQVCLVPHKSASLFDDIDVIVQQPGAKFRYLTSKTGYKNMCRISAICNTKQMWGLTKVNDLNYQCIWNSNPSTNWYWHVYTENNSGAAMNYHTRVKITYYCRLFNLNRPATS